MLEKITIEEVGEKLINTWEAIKNNIETKKPDIYIGEGIFNRSNLPTHPTRPDVKILFNNIYLELDKTLDPETQKGITEQGKAATEFRNTFERYLREGGDPIKLLDHIQNMIDLGLIDFDLNIFD